MVGLLGVVVAFIGLFAWFLYVNNGDLDDLYRDLESESDEDEERPVVVTDQPPPPTQHDTHR